MIPTKMRKMLGGFRGTCTEGVAGLVLSLVLGATLVAPHGPAWAAPGGPQRPSPKPDIPQAGPATQPPFPLLKGVQPPKENAWKLKWMGMAVNRNLGITTLYDVTSLKNKRFAVKLQEDSLFIKCNAKISTLVSFTEADLASWANNPHFTIAQYLFGKIKVKGGVEYIGNIVDEDVQKHFFDPVGPTSYHQQTEWMGVFPTLKKPGHYLLMCDFKNVPFGATIPGGTTFISARLTVYQDVPPDAFKVEIEEPAPKQIYDSGEAIIFRTYPTVEEFHPAGILYQVQRLEPDPTLKDSPLPVWQQGGYHQVWSTWTYPKYSVELPGNISLTLGWHRVRAHSQGSIDINTTFDQTSPWRYFFINTLVKIPPGVVQ